MDHFDFLMNREPWEREYIPHNAHPKKRGKGCVVHTYAWVGNDVSMGEDVKIQAFAFIPNGVTLGNNVFVGPHACFTNDRVPPTNEFAQTFVEDGARIGANATILPGITLGKGCLIGAGAVVTKDVPAGEVWVGNPARYLRNV